MKVAELLITVKTRNYFGARNPVAKWQFKVLFPTTVKKSRALVTLDKLSMTRPKTTRENSKAATGSSPDSRF